MKSLLLLIILFILCKVNAGDDSLIKIGQKNACIKNVIDSFVSSKDCDMLSDLQKSKIALKMTQCLLIQMKKALPSSCQIDHPSRCELHGDSWNTFSTFFTHVDNLCHFYWQALHHQKAQSLITKLSQSSDSAEKFLRQNAEQTKKIVYMQQKMHSSIQQSLQNQQRISKMIDDSSKNLHNLTYQMDSFLKKIHRDIDENYASLRNILSVMNEGILRILSFQAFITAELSSIHGMLYFLILFFTILFITSFKRYAIGRINSLFILSINIVLQLLLSRIIQSLLGINKFRYFFLLMIMASIYKNRVQQQQKRQDLSKYLNTPRLKTVIRRALQQKNIDCQIKSRVDPLYNQRIKKQLRLGNTY